MALAAYYQVHDCHLHADYLETGISFGLISAVGVGPPTFTSATQLLTQFLTRM